MAELSTVSTAADSGGNLGPPDILFQRETPDALTFPNSNAQEVSAQPPRYIAGHLLPTMVLRHSLGQTHDTSHYWRDFLATWAASNWDIPHTIHLTREHLPPDLTQTLASNEEEAGARELKRISGHLTEATALQYVLEKTPDDSQYLHEIDAATWVRSPAIPHTNNTWTLPSNVYTWIQDRLLESSHDKAALWASYPEIAERLEYLSSLEPNWDGYGSMAITVAAASKCTRLLIAIDRHIYSEGGEPFLAPMADGGLELEWECMCRRELMVVIPPEGTPVRYLLSSDNEADCMEESSGDFTEDSVVNTLLESILS